MPKITDLINPGLHRPTGPVVRPPLEFAKATVILFDDVPEGTVIDTQYSAKGVTFASITTSPAKRWHAYARSAWGMESAPNGISVVAPPQLCMFDARQGGIEAVFAKPQRWVSIDAKPMEAPEGMTAATAQPFLEAYDAAGKLLGRAEYPVAHSDAAWGSWQIVLYSSTTANIAKVIFSCSRDGNTPVYALFDRFAFAPERSLIARPLGG